MAGFHQRVPGPVDIAMVAHPAVTLLVDLTGGGCLAYRAGGRREHGSVVIGLAPGDLRASGSGVGECLQIRLEPVAAATVFGASAEFGGALVALDQLWGRHAGQVEERLRAATSWDARFSIAAELLGRRWETRRPVDPEVAQVWRRTLASRGRARVEGLADEVGWSRKRLWSRFRSQLGITPKGAARLVRFDHAAHLLAAGHDVARAAAESGYADQSHLHRDVRAYAGTTPTALAVAPWLAIDDVAWPGSSPALRS